MAYKLKPNKSMLSRFKITGTGKLKHHHANTSHLLSGRRAKKKRHLGRPAILSETHARNLRRFMGLAGKKPGRIAQLRARWMKQKQQEQQSQAATA